MKKYVYLFLISTSLFMTTGCIKEDHFNCEIGTTTIDITIKNGQIIKYVDEITGEITTEEINVLNENYLEDISDNQEAIDILKEIIALSGGVCN